MRIAIVIGLFAASFACKSQPQPPPPTATVATPPASGAAQGQSCPNGQCQPGLMCVEYYGIAGPSGPKFTSCEIPCAAPGAQCPNGQKCVTIADGPGRVCRPQRAD